MTNKLNKENSPYLLQHAENPVNWHPWSEEAFALASEKDLPIFLSIGYSTCHWCHVMETESFEDKEVANILNSGFISIKVDREQRPDLDSIYMAVCQMMTSRGGWPLTIIMTPDRVPFFAGTYFPKVSKNGLVGLLDLLPKVEEAWKTKREEVLKSADSIVSSLKNVSNPTIPDSFIKQEEMTEIFESLKDFFDEKYGGFGEAPKFPSPHNIIFLSKYSLDAKNKDALRMIDQTLTSMILGGIYDHIGFGFHRYSTDVKWLVPHFEKMLYDQALMLEALTEAHRLTNKDLFKHTTQEIYFYIKEILLSEEGGFFSAEDADSEGQEGTFYLWTSDELKKILTSDEYFFFEHLYNIEPDGNFNEEATQSKNGKNIVFLKNELETFASTFSLDSEMVVSEARRIKDKLKKERSKRIRPSMDDKILTDWNGLAISSFAKAARTFKSHDYLEISSGAFNFIKNKMTSNNHTLFHCYRDGKVAIDGMIDDYAFVLKASIDLYETTLNPETLKYGVEICNKMIDLFWDEEKGSFFATTNQDTSIIVRQKNLLDGAIPSGNYTALYGLIKIAGYTKDEELHAKAIKLSSQLGEMAKKFPINLTQFLSNHYSLLSENLQIVILNKNKEPNLDDELIDYIVNFRHLNKSIFYISSEYHKNIYMDILSTYDFIPELTDKLQIFICKDYSCQMPVSSLDEIKKVLNKQDNF